ncbi:hypothetical protein LTS18_003072 [Coniosporium uncinatum]|uniref:Uncharacterized protein n=1 Tax=Coniosporium uncinatum TaxID=93489 RepID=A0ACC3DY60_9PEZI|nr:hypothetical protein LTS18_003072 [Coniosporium uncinatum]
MDARSTPSLSGFTSFRCVEVGSTYSLPPKLPPTSQQKKEVTEKALPGDPSTIPNPVTDASSDSLKAQKPLVLKLKFSQDSRKRMPSSTDSPAPVSKLPSSNTPTSNSAKMPPCNASVSNAFKVPPSTVPTLSPKKRTIDEAHLDWDDIKKFIKRKKSEQQGHTQEKKSYKEEIIKLEDRVSQLDDANRKLDDELSRTRGRLTRANERSDELERERGHARKKLREVEEQKTRLAVLEKELE